MNIITKRLEIRPYTDADKDAVIRLLMDENIKETFMIPDFHSAEEAAGMFQKLKALSLSGEHEEAGIYLKNQLIGFVNDVDIDGDRIEMGYVINPEYHNFGYATEAMKGVITYLFQKGFTEIIAAAFEKNTASFRVMEKCGMARIDRTEDIVYHGSLQHCLYYSIKNNCPGNRKLQIKALQNTVTQWKQVCAYAASCSWKAGPFLARDMADNLFTGWERVFAAFDQGEIAGYCTLARKDCIPDVPYSPYIGYMFVGEKYRGRRLSQKLIQSAMSYARDLGFPKVYLVSGEKGLYEKYGFAKIEEKEDLWGNHEQIFEALL